MKKFILILALVLSVAILGACGDNQEAEYEVWQPRPTETPVWIDPNIDWSSPDINWSDYPIIVNGIGIAMQPHTAEGSDFPTHVPLLPVLAALNNDGGASEGTTPPVYTIEGLNGTIVFDAGSQHFFVDGQAITLAHHSIIIGNLVYVPIAFFRDVYGLSGAFWSGGHVHINTEADDMM